MLVLAMSRTGMVTQHPGPRSQAAHGSTARWNDWLAALEAALTAGRRGDLRHGTNAAYVQGCVCKECREHQRRRMAKNRG